MENTIWYKWKDRNKIENRNQLVTHLVDHSHEDSRLFKMHLTLQILILNQC